MPINAQFSGAQAQTARVIGLGGSGVNLQGIDAIRVNPSGITNLKGVAIGLHSETRFSIWSIHTVGLDIAALTKYGHLGMSISSTGNKHFKNQKIGLIYARKLMKNLSIGAQFDILRTSIKDYGDKLNYTFELGIQSEIFHNLHMAAHIYSHGNIKISEHDPIPSRIRFGFKYILSNKLKLYSEFYKNTEDKDDLRFGLEYNILQQLQLRMGIGTEPSNYSFGFSYLYKFLSIDFGISQHHTLGSTPAISIKYTLKK